ncbi:ubiquinol-cytochrome c reductase iron-sulfur subunit [Microaerobacter geothermalis]|uniref:QcrA and Rieske domain-containing protein n=1 Tax=Microaerobacter geothermalis TaxID=674972 RepID=UPI001F2250F5|nr:ubiquinol-cytochrome c reductase iron-sulfur subunit [Microaerobacter geothermalis]MCF6092525.1 ubiquinol-cytochrome c reductase iron-sulfur subunit [Microaerobacter geothermalis]
MELEKNPKQVNRRVFLKRSGGGILGFILGGMALPLLATPLAPKPVKSDSSLVDLGSIDELEKQLRESPVPIKISYDTKVKDGWAEVNTKGYVYITKEKETKDWLIMSPICTHLGCTVPYSSEVDNCYTDENGIVFHCPCHNAKYDEQGINIAGPARRPFDIFKPVVKDGRLYANVLSPIKRQPVEKA